MRVGLRTAPLVALVLVATPLSPSLLSAQTELRVSPRLGVLDPSGSFAEAAALDDGNYVSYQQIGAMALVGVDVLLKTSPAAGVRGDVATTFGGDALGMWDCQGGFSVEGEPIACPDFLLLVPSDVRVVTATADLFLSPPLGLGSIRPYVMAGAGIAHYRFQWQTEPDRNVDLEPGEGTRTDPGVHFGAGVRWEGPPFAMEVGVEDLVTWPDRPSGGSQHAPAFTAGVAFRIR